MERETALREALVSHLERSGVLRLPQLSAAMRAVPRHRFVPSVAPEEAYADRAIAIKTRGDEILSSVSQPGMVAQMLELLAPLPGDRVLEIGTGSGYNAALLAQIVGAGGRVTSVEVDPELAERARAILRQEGYDNVEVRAGDGARTGIAAEHYDRIIVTARSDDVPAAWWGAMREDARLVVPLRLEGAGEYAIGFIRRGNRLIGVGAYPCAFIALRGDAAAPAAGDIFYRNPAQRARAPWVRAIDGITAIRHTDATPSLLDEADIVVARPVTLFALTFASGGPPPARTS